MPENPIEEELHVSAEHHQAGRFGLAEAGYHRILARDPNRADALQAYGILAAQLGRPEMAVDLMRRAIELDPNQPGIHANLGLALQTANRPAEAVFAYREAVQREPESANIHHRLGKALNASGQFDEAVAAYREALRLEPGAAKVCDDLGVTLQAQERYAEAEEAHRRAIEIDPAFAEAFNNLGVALRRQGRTDEAIEIYRRGLVLTRELPALHRNLASTLLASGRFNEGLLCLDRAREFRPNDPDIQKERWDAYLSVAIEQQRNGRLTEAEALCRRVLEENPRLSGAWSFLGRLAQDAGRAELAVELLNRAALLEPGNAQALHELAKALSAAKRDLEAIAVYQSALRANAGDAELQNDLGAVLARTGRLEEAETAFCKAIELDSDHVEARCNLGAALNEQHYFDAAIDAYREAIRIRPDFAEAHRSLGYALAHVGKLDEAISSYQRAVELNPADAATDGYSRFLLYYHPAWDAAGILREQRIWNERYAKPLASAIRPQRREHSARRSRIGYVSPHFHYHVVGHHMLALFREHDRTQFEIFAYSNVEKPDALTAELSQVCDHWRDIRGKTDAEAADLIRTDRIDILIDLALHTDGNRLLVFARKPAPVQTAYLGYCGTTGMDAMDYRLSDPYLDPPDSDLTCYSEQTIRLPQSYWCYQPAGPAPAVSSLPAKSAGFVTFVCLNDFTKVSDLAFDLWLKILRATPGSRLVLHAPDGTTRETLIGRMRKESISSERIEFVGFQPWEQYLECLARADIALDPLPYGGGITTLDALWMGLPVVTLSGQTVVGRGGASILSNLGLPELIAHTPEQYIEIAARLADDLPRLGELRATLRERMERSPLRDATRLARDLETTYKEMWTR